MLTVFAIILVAAIVAGIIIDKKTDPYEYDGVAVYVISGLLLFIVVICMIVNTAKLVNIRTIDSKVEMYQQENAIIENRVGQAVEKYMEHEKGVFSDVTNRESYITLISFYPELKSDELISKQIEVYLQNKDTITKLRESKINESVYRWWLYFGK